MASRTSLNVSLPKPLRDWVDRLVIERDYSTASEYIRELVREDRNRRIRTEVDAKLHEALASGPALPMTRKDWDSVRARMRTEINHRQRRKSA